ncbi:MAG: response regulator [Verrucomicrobiaceae bacterium]|nr:response regulator [Verrucomicrobiaceae bacterium]
MTPSFSPTTHLGKDSKNATLQSRKKEKTILIVEDESSVRETVSHNLSYLGYTVLEACNGEEALAICRNYKHKLDLIFTDVVMPRLSGPSMISMLQKENIRPPVLYTTGYADAPGLRKTDPVLIKPYTTKSLAARIREIFATA